jgi:signal transduction histidine kinase
MNQAAAARQVPVWLPDGQGTKKTQVLLVEDNPADVDLIRGLLALSDCMRFELTHAGSLGQGLRRLARGGVDVLLLDLNLPDSGGLGTARKARAAAPDLPIVILTGVDERSLALQAVQEGAQEYLIKADVDSRLLERSIHYAVERQRLMAEVNRNYQKERELGRFKTELVSMVSHEFANALSVVEVALPFLEESAGPGLSEQTTHLFRTIEKNVRALDSTVHNLVHLGRLEDGKFTLNLRRAEVAPLVRKSLGALELLYERKAIRVAFKIAPGPLAVKADPEALAFVISNLLSNAIKYTPKDGAVIVSVGVDPEHADRALISVQDTGIGISRQDQERIFTRYYRTENGKKTAQGFGVGLAFVKTMLEAHGSAVKVKSVPGKGSRFSFTLPLWDEDEDQGQAGGAAQEIGADGR